MADAIYIRCPECGDKFKSSADKEGKKVTCPECDESFRVTAKMIVAPKGAKPETDGKEAKKEPRSEIKAKKEPKPAPAPAPAPAPPPPAELAKPAEANADEDEGENPYGMVEVVVKARCPSCAKELLNEKDIICVHCGYNMLTREVGKTQRTIEMTGSDQFAHLLPAMGALAFVFFLVLFLIWFSVSFPRQFRGTWIAGWFDYEFFRLWGTIIALFMMYSAGYFGLKQIIFNPKPKEKEKE